ncbi:hypothetical protein TREMEDRAFT_31494 [Tremella mesenterica DSM 1558]|uniref:uncharacterized protein n=1 Tax=Tremella mesenterica (strain ATCC 24925 / CBS 8224 / DSM 1558 / NBRC 9311 / NRRL Y-6157 / RJB 2259-6 / UBC 559-6) TaxID=578456 RepID=UPI0003F497FE|nr:uncharacterized protein TREMEDRAFT_31494 [Tremella mesenterica DSM 1558]EIW69113.1 hypothetical protein TREMEDRAFT_31494 [Tremella mesenterica DSM 1558]
MTSASTRPYSAFSRRTKILIVVLGAISAIFSPISSNIYVPAIPVLAEKFGRSEQDLSLGVTVYLIFQAITPSFFGSMSDSIGRRPVYIGTLILYMAANIGLALVPTSSYAGLLVLRMLQATGGSAVISIGAGCISDIAEPRERGRYFGFFQAGAVIGPAFGPLLGGVLAQTLGWRSIFWFLTIATGVVLVPLIFFLPETLRSLVGDGSIPPPALNCSPGVLLQRRRMQKANDDLAPEEHIERPPRKKVSLRLTPSYCTPDIQYEPLSAFIILLTPEILLVFIFVSLLYVEFYNNLTVYSTALKDSYGLSELKIGLCYLPSGIGSVCSSLLNGRQIDYYYRREERRVGGDYRKKGEEFKIEYTRLRCIIPFMALFIVAATALGWCLEAKAPLAATLVVNFFVGLGTGTINTATVYGQDLKPGQGGAVSASLNLVRCLFGAVGTAVIQIIYRKINAGWTFVLFSGLCIAGIPIPFIAAHYGPSWRQCRAERSLRKSVGKKEKEKDGGVIA